MHTFEHTCMNTDTCTCFLCLFLLPAIQVWVISWDANNYRSDSKGWTDEPQMNTALRGALTAACTQEATSFPCMALLSASLASKQVPSPLFRATGKGCSSFFHGTRQKGNFERGSSYSLFLWVKNTSFFLSSPWSFRCSNEQYHCYRACAGQGWWVLDIAWNRNGSTEEHFGVKPQLSRSSAH